MSTKTLFYSFVVGLAFVGTQVLACGSKFFEPEQDSENFTIVNENSNPNQKKAPMPRKFKKSKEQESAWLCVALGRALTPEQRDSIANTNNEIPEPYPKLPDAKELQKQRRAMFKKDFQRFRFPILGVGIGATALFCYGTYRLCAHIYNKKKTPSHRDLSRNI